MQFGSPSPSTQPLGPMLQVPSVVVLSLTVSGSSVMALLLQTMMARNCSMNSRSNNFHRHQLASASASSYLKELVGGIPMSL